MIVVRQCKCGCTDFYKEDDGTLRCENCCSLAKFENIREDDTNEHAE